MNWGKKKKKEKQQQTVSNQFSILLVVPPRRCRSLPSLYKVYNVCKCVSFILIFDSLHR